MNTTPEAGVGVAVGVEVGVGVGVGVGVSVGVGVGVGDPTVILNVAGAEVFPQGFVTVN